jgi:rhamnosyltransferase
MKISILLDEANQFIDNSVQWNTMHQIGKELENTHEISFIDTKILGQEKALSKLLEQDYELLLMYNKTGTNLTSHSESEPVLKLIDRPTVSWLVEHPITFHDNYINIDSNKRHYILANTQHSLFTKKMGLLGFNESILFGSSIKKNLYQPKDRKYDVCIAAQWRGSGDNNEFWKNRNQTEKDFFEKINYLQNQDDNCDVFTAFCAVAEFYGISNDKYNSFLPSLKALYWHARKKERIKMVQDMVSTGLKILLIGGEGWKEVLPDHSNVTFLGVCSHNELMIHYQNSRAVVSTNCFNGANERTFDALSCGCISISEKSPTLSKSFGKNGIVFYDRFKLNERNRYIIDLINSAGSLESFANNGLEDFKNSHTWQHRAMQLNTFIEKVSTQKYDLSQFKETSISNINLKNRRSPASNRVIIFAHYDPNGKVHLDTQDLIKELYEYSNQIIFVSTNISDESFQFISKYCKIIKRENYGYDFWSYKVGLDHISNYKEVTSIILINNSFIATNPIKLCDNYFSLNKDDKCLFGLTISNEKLKHIQSFWIEFTGTKIIHSSSFKDWWESMKPISNQKEVIEKYEIGLSSHFNKLGFSLNSLFNPTDIDKIIGSMRSIINKHYALDESITITDKLSVDANLANNLNPTSLLWYELLNRCHFIKTKTIGYKNRDFNEFFMNKYLLNLPDIERKKAINYLIDRDISNQSLLKIIADIDPK